MLLSIKFLKYAQLSTYLQKFSHSDNVVFLSLMAEIYVSNNCLLNIEYKNLSFNLLKTLLHMEGIQSTCRKLSTLGDDGHDAKYIYF